MDRTVYLPVRVPVIFVDGAHNEDAALKLKVTVERYFSDYKKIFIMGVFKDKEYEKITSILCRWQKVYILLVLPNKERTLPAEKAGRSSEETLSESES